MFMGMTLQHWGCLANAALFINSFTMVLQVTALIGGCNMDLGVNWRLKTKHTLIVAAFRGMHVSPAKHSYVWLLRKCDYRTDTYTHGQTDARQSDPYVPLCLAGDTKISVLKFKTPRISLLNSMCSSQMDRRLWNLS